MLIFKMLPSVKLCGAFFFPLLLLSGDYLGVGELTMFLLETWGHGSALLSSSVKLYNP